jgi:hypothetical protein
MAAKCKETLMQAAALAPALQKQSANHPLHHEHPTAQAVNL